MRRVPNAGVLVTLEGLDGSGKTSCIGALKASPSIPTATYTREPTHTWYGEAVRRSLNDDDADPLAELFLYTADHAAHLADVIGPALDRGELVVSDRYSDSRYAYQGATLADRFVRVDATEPEETVVERVVEAVAQLTAGE